MKKLIASIFALTLIGAMAANADVGVRAHVGGGGVHVGIGDGHRHHVRHCVSWGWRHHHHERYCRRWSW
jgi:hypothetical protein